MIKLFSNPQSPNGQKIAIMLAETNLPSDIVTVDLSGQTPQPEEFIKLSPKGSVPAIIDTQTDVRLFESTAILVHLAEKAGMLLPESSSKRAEVMEWLMFEASRIAPSAGAWFYFKMIAPNEQGDGLDFNAAELTAATQIIDKRLENREYICDEFSIADIAYYPWVFFLTEYVGLSAENYPNLARWASRMSQRPSIVRGSENNQNAKAA
ncbi:Glutathione S-transferase [hydrothermal vent metagenome]|uniref:Glutathione S-transferase n=1 Tax=hydrothermal vent metagenome TaxID=652676 RepID=A0A3B0X125_9ZZZZ